MSLPLPTLEFYRLPDVFTTAATLANFLDTLFSATLTVDYRGTSIPAASRWTATRFQNAGTTEAVYYTPPAGTPMTIVPRILFAGAAAGAPTMGFDTFSAGLPLVGINKNSGAFLSWTAIFPFTSGQWSGFNRAAMATAIVINTTIRVYVSAEVIILDIWNTPTTHTVVIVGACVEAYTDFAGTTNESDSRLYGSFTTGSFGNLGAAFLNTVGFFDHNPTNGSPHGYVFQPGTSSIYGCGRTMMMQSSSATGGEVDMASAFIGRAIDVSRSTANNTQNGQVLGRLRETYLLGTVQGALTRRNGSDDLFHVIGASSSGVEDAFSIKAAP